MDGTASQSVSLTSEVRDVTKVSSLPPTHRTADTTSSLSLGVADVRLLFEPLAYSSNAKALHHHHHCNIVSTFQ